jgi:thiopeptide-type bacteriocin biosynthesis protein
VRLRGAPATLVGPTLAQACAWAGELVTSGVVTRFSFETYEREVERYGGAAGVRVAESVFAADSAVVTELLAAAPPPYDDPITTAVAGADDLLDGLGLSPADRLAFYRSAGATTRSGGREYRARGAVLRSALRRAALRAEPFGRRLRPARSALTAAAQELASLRRRDLLARTPTDLYRSFVHLHLNRLLGPDAAREQLIMELLLRTRESLVRTPSAEIYRAPPEIASVLSATPAERTARDEVSP